MKHINLEDILVGHNVRIGDDCPYYEANIKEDCILYDNGIPVGFYLSKMPDKLCKLADIADSELRSDNVSKALMRRASLLKLQKKLGLTTAEANKYGVAQYSTIIGSIPPKPMMRRHLPNQSSLHSVPSAKRFLKAMLMMALESEKLIKELTPNIWEEQVELFKEVPEKWRFGNIFTSSISNYNISAPFHRDTGNIIGAVNVIITKRKNTKGGCLHVPDYNATFEQADNSILVYPAWKSVHGVTPIVQTYDTGYRNSLIFYPLKAFTNDSLNKNLSNDNEEEN